MAGAPGYDDEFMRTASAAAHGELALHRQGLHAVKRGSRSLAEHQLRFYHRVDLALMGAAMPEGRSLACREGCSYCCHYHVYVSAPEAHSIADRLRSRAKLGELDRVKQRLQENVNKVANMTVEEHVATNVTCAFLSEAGGCSIYEVRPVACRKHHALDADPCRVTYEDPSASDQADQSAEHLAVAQGLFTAAIAAMESSPFGS